MGAEGLVLNHYDAAAIQAHLKAVGEPMLKALAKTPPYAIFSDSLEVYNSDWTGNFLAEFQKRRGYDLTPYLPALAGLPLAWVCAGWQVIALGAILTGLRALARELGIGTAGAAVSLAAFSDD